MVPSMADTEYSVSGLEVLQKVRDRFAPARRKSGRASAGRQDTENSARRTRTDARDVANRANGFLANVAGKVGELDFGRFVEVESAVRERADRPDLLKRSKLVTLNELLADTVVDVRAVLARRRRHNVTADAAHPVRLELELTTSSHRHRKRREYIRYPLALVVRVGQAGHCCKHRSNDIHDCVLERASGGVCHRTIWALVLIVDAVHEIRTQTRVRAVELSSAGGEARAGRDRFGLILENVERVKVETRE